MVHLAYLATPYSKYPDGIARAFVDSAEVCARLLQIGVVCYSPIVHSHPLAVHGHLDPLDHSFWQPVNERIMERCDVLIVAQMAGWQESQGIADEVEFFQKMGKPILDLDVASLHMKRRADVVGYEIKEGAL